MMWCGERHGEPITDQSIVDAARAFWNELSALKKSERELKEKLADEAYAKDCEQHDAEIKNGLCPKCGTYCYGDCEANN
jgi:ribosomal protein L32